MSKRNLEVNNRILKEIEALNSDENQKLFLREIMEFELENIDKEMPKYTEEYKNLIAKIFRWSGTIIENS